MKLMLIRHALSQSSYVFADDGVCHRHQRSGVRQPLVTSAWRSLNYCLLPSASLAWEHEPLHAPLRPDAPFDRATRAL